jgi:serine/threonine-protein phosphatase 2A regulatory subunit B''
MGYGYLREQDLENFVYALIPNLPCLEDLQENFYPFYVFTAVRKFLFFLDVKRTGKVSLDAILESPVLEELMQLQLEHPVGR